MARRRPLSLRLRRIAVAGTAAAVVVTPLAAFLPSHAAGPLSDSAAEAGCPTVFPEESLVDEQAVSVATVTRGTTIEEIPGIYLGTLADGIAPGVDMILVELDAPVVDKAGIWQGMSGSPVTDPATGELIGAVSYALSMGPSNIAGLTPAAEMYRMLETSEPAETVSLPRRMATDLVAQGTATRAQAASGLSRLRIPVGVSGLSSPRLAQIAPKLGLRDVYAAGTTSGEAIPVSAGSNLAASVSYGLITAAGVGTATAVCGDTVLAFGHPMTYGGPSSMSLHGARAITIQSDPTFSSFKVANIGAPIGTIDQDRMAGLRGHLGATPGAVPVTSSAVEGTESFGGTTHVTVPEMVTEMALTTMVAAQDRVLDRSGKGAGVVTWTVTGLRRNGTPFTLTRTDRYADAADISSAPAMALAQQLMAIVENEFEEVTITSVTTRSRLDERFASWRLGRVEQRIAGVWTPLATSGPVRLRPGGTKVVRVRLAARDSGPTYVTVPITAPRRGRGAGHVTLTGNWDSWGDYFEDFEFMYLEEMEERPQPRSFPALLEDLRTAPRNDVLVATSSFINSGRSRTRTVSLDRVVQGSKRIRVVVR
ncbi:hypothetical protein [Nocardioides pacificus]